MRKQQWISGRMLVSWKADQYPTGCWSPSSLQTQCVHPAISLLWPSREPSRIAEIRRSWALIQCWQQQYGAIIVMSYQLFPNWTSAPLLNRQYNLDYNSERSSSPISIPATFLVFPKVILSMIKPNLIPSLWLMPEILMYLCDWCRRSWYTWTLNLPTKDLAVTSHHSGPARCWSPEKLITPRPDVGFPVPCRPVHYRLSLLHMLILTTWYIWTSDWFLIHHQLSLMPTSRTGFSSWLPAVMPNQINVWRRWIPI